MLISRGRKVHMFYPSVVVQQFPSPVSMYHRRNFWNDHHRACWFSVHTHLLLQHLYIYIYIILRPVRVVSSSFPSFSIESISSSSLLYSVSSTSSSSPSQKKLFPQNFRIQRSYNIVQYLSYDELIFCDLYANDVKYRVLYQVSAPYYPWNMCCNLSCYLYT